jgi:hypothetical protein
MILFVGGYFIGWISGTNDKDIYQREQVLEILKQCDARQGGARG